jgi:3-oxoacyl-(acyl-carrier-protein) synthase
VCSSDLDSIDGAPAAHVALRYALGGPNQTCTDGELSGEMALVAGLLAIDAGRAESMVVVAGDELTWPRVAVLERLGVLSTDETPRPRGPYDRHRRGSVPAELVAALVMEDRARAERRGARVYAVLGGPGLGSEQDAGPRQYPRRPDNHRQAFARALARAGIGEDAVDLFSGAGAGLPDLDAVELAAAEHLAVRSEPTWLVGLRGLFGHCPSDGVLRIGAACLALRDGFVPPTVGLVTPDPATNLRWSDRAAVSSPRVVLHHGVARGGQCVSLVLRRP